MTKICNFPIAQNKRCTQPVTDDKPNCGRHKTDISADQLGQNPTIYEKDDELHVWAGEPDGLYCLIHNDPAYQALYQVAGEKQPCCLSKDVAWRDKDGKWHRDDGPAVIRADGTQEWYQHGYLHRDGEPAVIRPDGAQEWRQNDNLHRDDGPAWIGPDGSQEWWQNGQRHRDDGPAVIEADGTQWWCQHGRVHRDDGPAVIKADGTREWYQHDKWHRDDGPARILPDGTQKWYQRSRLHREDGPAIIWADGTQEWWQHGEKVTEEEHEQSRGARFRSCGVLSHNNGP